MPNKVTLKAARFISVLAGIPLEIGMRVCGKNWTLKKTVSVTGPGGWTLSAYQGMEVDHFTYVPDLRTLNGELSQAAAIHDKGWLYGTKDNGDILTFDENTLAFRMVLDREEHANWIKDVYEWGVSLPFMRKRWVKKFGHK